MNRVLLIATIATFHTACAVQPSATLQTCPQNCEQDLRQWIDYCTTTYVCDDVRPRDNGDRCHNKRAICMIAAYDFRSGCYSGQCSEPGADLETVTNVWRGVSVCLEQVPNSDVSICYGVGT